MTLTKQHYDTTSRSTTPNETQSNTLNETHTEASLQNETPSNYDTLPRSNTPNETHCSDTLSENTYQSETPH